MNPETLNTSEVKRGPGRPRKETPQQTEPALPSDGTFPEPPPTVIIDKTTATQPPHGLGYLYSAIDAAPKEWLPSLLAKVMGRSMRDSEFTVNEITAMAHTVASRVAKNL